MVAEMQAIMARHDVLVMAGGGPAPRLSPALAAWPAPNRFQASNITGNPAIVVPAGFGSAGLPLSIHLREAARGSGDPASVFSPA
jgi:Asp-tRNA(Asn)/Glu-tRNA(Gln) amidotransferase A subunit family amidase